MTEAMLKRYKVWDAPTRLFHWVNFTTVLLLILVGLLMIYKKDIGITSLEAKIAIKEIHILIGYIFTLNLLIRLVWGFVGNRFARWSRIVPGKGFGAVLSGYIASIRSGNPQQFLGHNPLGRLAVVALMLMLMTQAVTGLVRAGTDVYYPPFGAMFAAQVAADGVNPASLKPYDKTGVDAAKLKALGAFKSPFGEVHLYTAYALILLILLHIAAVVRAEISEGGGMVSAMFSGSKTLSKQPEDLDD
ncbi:cytochrome b/b6 domain-containing protein [Mariprofundus ferrooxydans]|uniref:Cytochrome b, putative n=1 Tax=Mariprofundus ferrooxydans PV-1 TaxID=314345 RepID=Q0F1D6_9PROT|nr:cytochrome b/b6 domain-containing protein [Mariprofundus ferrooxydans]EAU55255.1 cytochrome b, putative [Mariprofundus ferrooxydans PV-1]KON47220.1 cytochrome B [Mariprofundus ferrooxydans]